MPLSISSIPGHGSNIDTRGLFSALRYCSRQKVVECTFYATSFPGSLLFPSPRDPGTRLHSMQCSFLFSRCYVSDCEFIFSEWTCLQMTQRKKASESSHRTLCFNFIRFHKQYGQHLQVTCRATICVVCLSTTRKCSGNKHNKHSQLATQDLRNELHDNVARI